jgi:hypothetical protein
LLEERALAPERVVKAALADADRVEELGWSRGAVASFPEEAQRALDRAVEVEESRAANNQKL